MQGKNIFSGNSKQSKFARIIYKRLVCREWFSYTDIMLEHEGLQPVGILPYSISCYDDKLYRELKKAFMGVRKAIINIIGNDDFIEIDGNNRNKKFRYIGCLDNPLSEMIATIAKDSLEVYYRFCQDSAAFFPSVWLEYFLGDTMNLLNIDKAKYEGLQIVESSADRLLNNIENLPYVYECIRSKIVLEISFQAKYKESITIVFHPHFLKEFNGRWYLVGHAEDKRPSQGFIIPLDRILRISELSELSYQVPNQIKYPDFFQDIIGTTHNSNNKLVSITVRIYGNYMFGLITTKPIHHTQNIVMDFNDNKGYGEIEMTLCPNNEFFGSVLQMGHNLEIVSPNEVREDIAKRIYSMSARYAKE